MKNGNKIAEKLEKKLGWYSLFVVMLGYCFQGLGRISQKGNAHF